MEGAALRLISTGGMIVFFGITDMLKSVRENGTLYLPETKTNYNTREFELNKSVYASYLRLRDYLTAYITTGEVATKAQDRENDYFTRIITKANGDIPAIQRVIDVIDELEQQIESTNGERAYNTHPILEFDNQELASCLGLNKKGLNHQYVAVYDLSSITFLIIAMLLKIPQVEVETELLSGKYTTYYDFLNAYAHNWSTSYANTSNSVFKALHPRAADFVMHIYNDYLQDRLYAGSSHLKKDTYSFNEALTYMLSYTIGVTFEYIMNEIMRELVREHNISCHTTGSAITVVASKGYSSLILYSNDVNALQDFYIDTNVIGESGNRVTYKIKKFIGNFYDVSLQYLLDKM